MDLNDKLLDDFKQLITNATEEESLVLAQVVQGIRQKREGKYRTYIMSFMQSTTKHEGDELLMTIPLHPILHNSVEIVHGGLSATLADTAMGTLVNERILDTQVAVTSEIKMNYTAPGVGNFLTCSASILHLGSKTSVTEAKIYNDEGVLVAVATGSFFIIKRPKRT